MKYRTFAGGWPNRPAITPAHDLLENHLRPVHRQGQNPGPRKTAHPIWRDCVPHPSDPSSANRFPATASYWRGRAGATTHIGSAPANSAKVANVCACYTPADAEYRAVQQGIPEALPLYPVIQETCSRRRIQKHAPCIRIGKTVRELALSAPRVRAH